MFSVCFIVSKERDSMNFEEKKPWNGQKHEKPNQEKSEYPKNKETANKEAAPKGEEKHEKWGSESKKGCGCK